MTLGEKIRELRESKGLYQRQIASAIEVDTAYISKVEKSEKKISRNHLKTLAKLLDVEEKELQKLWLADKVYKILEDEPFNEEVLKVAEAQIHRYKTKKK